MTASCKRMIFPLSSPDVAWKPSPADDAGVVEWRGRCLPPAAQSPQWNSTEPPTIIGQANNVLAFPGIGLGVIVTGARLITRAHAACSAKAIAHQANPTNPGDFALCRMSVTVLGNGRRSCYQARQDRGGRTHDDIRQAMIDTMAPGIWWLTRALGVLCGSLSALRSLPRCRVTRKYRSRGNSQVCSGGEQPPSMKCSLPQSRQDRDQCAPEDDSRHMLADWHCR